MTFDIILYSVFWPTNIVERFMQLGQCSNLNDLNEFTKRQKSKIESEAKKLTLSVSDCTKSSRAWALLLE